MIVVRINDGFIEIYLVASIRLSQGTSRILQQKVKNYVKTNPPLVINRVRKRDQKGRTERIIGRRKDVDFDYKPGCGLSKPPFIFSKLASRYVHTCGEYVDTFIHMYLYVQYMFNTCIALI